MGNSVVVRHAGTTLIIAAGNSRVECRTRYVIVCLSRIIHNVFSEAEIAWRTINDWLAGSAGCKVDRCSCATRFPRQKNTVDYESYYWVMVALRNDALSLIAFK